MVGGQVLIIFVGGEAFKIVRLDGKEWGLSIGLGAISLPWGAAIRLFPDAWVAAILPWFIRKKWAPETIDDKLEKEHREETEGLHPPLRIMTGLRGPRARNHVGFRQKMHDAKVIAKDAINPNKSASSSDNEKNEKNEKKRR
jgi:P-type Ca2+ transporter type 2C